MKKITPILVFVILIISMGFVPDSPYYSTYKPILMMRAEMENSVKLLTPQKISQAGKIYLKDTLILINEKYRGIHLIDNSNPASPNNFAFINIDGCIDMAMKGNVLYADNAVDLIAIRLHANAASIEVTKRIKNTFPVLNSPTGRSLRDEELKAIPEGAILVRWDKN